MKHIYKMMVHRSSVTDNLGGKIALIAVSLILILLVVLAAIAYWKQKKRRSNTGEYFLIFHIL